MGTINGSVTDEDRNEHHVEVSGTTVGVGQHLFSVSAAANMDAIAVFNAAKPPPETGTGDNPL